MVLHLGIAKGYQIGDNKQVNFPMNKSEKVLILGFGDLGSRLVKLLDPANYYITGVCRRRRDTDAAHLQIINLDLYQPKSFAELFQTSFDVIVISMTPAERSDAGYQLAYVQTCKLLLEQLQSSQQKPRLILFVSSTSVYAQCNGEWIDETSPAEPENFSGRRLLEAEKLLQESEFPVCVIRFSGIYGPGRDRLIRQVKTGQLLSSSAFTNRIHADDCARAIAHMIEYQKYTRLDSLYIATDNYPTPMNEIQEWLAEQMNVEQVEWIDKSEERSNKKINNVRLRKTGFDFLYDSYKDGYAILLSQL